MENNTQEKQVIEQLAHFWSNNLPFNNLLGLTVKSFDCTTSEVRFLWQDKLMGNPVQKILHGGVIASALDLAGGVVVSPLLSSPLLSSPFFLLFSFSLLCSLFSN